MKNKPEQWFKMPEIKKRFFDKSSWIPLKKAGVLLKEGERGHAGFLEEYFGVGSILVPLTQKDEAEKLGWTEIGTSGSTMGYVEGGEYVPAYSYKSYESDLIAERLVIECQGNSEECNDWLINTDLIATLHLKQEKDTWVSISRGYEEVVKIERNEYGCPNALYIKAQYLKDYLCARKMALYMTSYRSRTQIMEDTSGIKWVDPFIEKVDKDRWEGRISEIHEGGHPFGTGFSMMHVSRTDVDFDEDIPELDFADDKSTVMEHKTGNFKGRKLYRVNGELWRNEWVEPSEISSIVCDDKVKSTYSFFTDNSGKTENGDDLDNGKSRWLWFKASVVNEILSNRGGSLSWYTRDTGGIESSSGYDVHFGINEIGLINVFAKDIGLLPNWQQKVWASHNIVPDGKVSTELLMSQMKAKPASTQAPEEFLQKGIDYINSVSKREYGMSIVNEHTGVEGIGLRVHRFRSANKDGLLELAKDLYRITGERFNASAIKNIIKPEKSEKWGPLKSLEKLVALKVGDRAAYRLMSPFWGVYTLRKLDTHLTSDDLAEALKLCNIKESDPLVVQGRQLIHVVVSTIHTVGAILDSSRGKK